MGDRTWLGLIGIPVSRSVDSVAGVISELTGVSLVPDEDVSTDGYGAVGSSGEKMNVYTNWDRLDEDPFWPEAADCPLLLQLDETPRDVQGFVRELSSALGVECKVLELEETEAPDEEYEGEPRELEDGHLQLSFYFAGLSDADALAALIPELVEMGAKFSGIGVIYRGVGFHLKPFASIYELDSERVRIESLKDVSRYLHDPNTLLGTVYMLGASGTTRRLNEVVAYGRISEEAAAQGDHHPIEIWSEGWPFIGPLDEEYKEIAETRGMKAHERFIAIIEATRPSYAAITVEYDLECPTDLRRDPGSLAFGDFYVSRDFLGEAGFQRVMEVFSEAYVREAANGAYISSYRFPNPESRSLDSTTASDLSAKVAKIIASSGKGER